MNKQVLLESIAKLIDKYECPDTEHLEFLIDCEITFWQSGEKYYYNGTSFEKLEIDNKGRVK